MADRSTRADNLLTMKKGALVAGLAAILLLPGCGNYFDPAAAVVDGHKVPASLIENAAANFRKTANLKSAASQGTPDQLTRQFAQNYLSRLVLHDVLAPRAQELGVTVTDAEVTARIAKIKKNFKTEAQFEQAVRGQGLTDALLHDLIRDDLLSQAVRGA